MMSAWCNMIQEAVLMLNKLRHDQLQNDKPNPTYKGIVP